MSRQIFGSLIVASLFAATGALAADLGDGPGDGGIALGMAGFQLFAHRGQGVMQVSHLVVEGQQFGAVVHNLAKEYPKQTESAPPVSNPVADSAAPDQGLQRPDRPSSSPAGRLSVIPPRKTGAVTSTRPPPAPRG